MGSQKMRMNKWLFKILSFCLFSQSAQDSEMLMLKMWCLRDGRGSIGYRTGERRLTSGGWKSLCSLTPSGEAGLP